MTKIHELKILPQFLYSVIKGDKTFEVRKNDRDFEVGDIVRLREWNPDTQTYGEFDCECDIIYLLDNPEYCKEGYVILGITHADPMKAARDLYEWEDRHNG